MPFLAVIVAADADAAKRVAKAFRPDDPAARIVGLYALPTPKAERAVHTPCTGTQHSGWVRDEKGFMRCVCGGRHPSWRQWLVAGLAERLGWNLLPRDKTMRMFQNPETIDAQRS